MSQKDIQSRKWQLTINNPKDKGFTHDRIKLELEHFKSLLYYCMADEQGSSYHTHLYIVFSSAVRFSTLKKRFPEAHIELARGTSQQNRDYINKDGKWLNDSKHGTKVEDTFEEAGEIPTERQGQRNDLNDLYDKLKVGASDYDILEESPEYMMMLDKIQKARQTILAERYKTVFRKMEVTFIWGETGVGKTRYVMEKYGYENVFRASDYKNPFDHYENQDIMILDEYNSQLNINELINYMDGYPVTLRARYFNKIACFTKFYIISNIDLKMLHPFEKQNYPKIWDAMIRRIHKVMKFNKDGTYTEYETNQYLYGNAFELLPADTPTPFDDDVEMKSAATRVVQLKIN